VFFEKKHRKRQRRGGQMQKPFQFQRFLAFSALYKNIEHCHLARAYVVEVVIISDI
jgi:hypothetical protein